MRTIHKFNFTPDQRDIHIKMPKGARPLHVGLDPSGTPAIWATVQSTILEKETQMFQVVGTGHLLPIATWSYLGSFTEGPFTWHIYHFDHSDEADG